jgi:hypothetical protein
VSDDRATRVRDAFGVLLAFLKTATEEELKKVPVFGGLVAAAEELDEEVAANQADKRAVGDRVGQLRIGQTRCVITPASVVVHRDCFVTAPLRSELVMMDLDSGDFFPPRRHRDVHLVAAGVSYKRLRPPRRDRRALRRPPYTMRVRCHEPGPVDA